MPRRHSLRPFQGRSNFAIVSGGTAAFVHYHLNPATDYHFFRLQMPPFWVVRKMAVVFWALQSKELWHVELAQDGGTTNNPRAGPAGLVVSPDRGGSWR